MASQWVATPTRDIGYLLQRRESEALSAWKRRAELAKRQAVLATEAGRKISTDGSTEIWSFADAPAIQPTIRSCMTAAKAAGASESSWLDYADRAVQTAERSFKEALRTQAIPMGWEVDNPRPNHETKGGALGDIPQKAVPFLDGLSLSAAKDKVVRVAIGLDQTNITSRGRMTRMVLRSRSRHSEYQSASEEEVDNPPAPTSGPRRISRTGSSKPAYAAKKGKQSVNPTVAESSQAK